MGRRKIFKYEKYPEDGSIRDITYKKRIFAVDPEKDETLRKQHDKRRRKKYHRKYGKVRWKRVIEQKKITGEIDKDGCYRERLLITITS